MRGKSRAKNELRRSEESEGSRWEFILFGLIFVTIVFVMGTLARADEARPAQARGHQKSKAKGKIKPTPVASAPSSVSAQPTLSNRLNSRTSMPRPTILSPSQRFAFSASLTLDTARTLDSEVDTDYNGTYQLNMVTTYNPLAVSAGLLLTYTREYVFERPDGSPGGFEDTRYSFRKTWKNGTDFNFTAIDELYMGLGGFLPTSKLSQDRGMQFSGGPRLGVLKRFGKATVNTTVGYTRGFFNTEIDATGRTNVVSTYLGVLGLSYAFTEALSIGTSLEYAYQVDYQDFDSGVQRAVFSLDYKWMKNLATSVGVGTVRSTVDLVQQTETFKFYEKESSVAFFDLILSI